MPIPKTENEFDSKNYRLILLLSITNKILKRPIHGKSSFAICLPSVRESVRILFLKLTIQTSTNDWLELLESGIQAAAVFFCFCFCFCFDSVSHKASIEKLQAWMSTFWNWYWLLHKLYAVCCSEWCIFKASPCHFRWSVLGPLLFLFTSTESTELLNYHYHLRAN